MQLLITATDKCTHIGGVSVRLWGGTTEEGVPCKVFVYRIAVANSCDASAFENELKLQLAPAFEISLLHFL